MVSVGRGRGRVHFRVRRRCRHPASFIKKSRPEERPKEIGDCVRLSHQPSAQHTRGAEYSRPEQCNAARLGSGTADVKRFGMNPADRSAVRVNDLDTAWPGSCGEPPRCRSTDNVREPATPHTGLAESTTLTVLCACPLSIPQTTFCGSQVQELTNCVQLSHQSSMQTPSLPSKVQGNQKLRPEFIPASGYSSLHVLFSSYILPTALLAGQLTHMEAPSKARSKGDGPLASTQGVIPPLTEPKLLPKATTFFTVPPEPVVTQMLAPSKATIQGAPPTVYSVTLPVGVILATVPLVSFAVHMIVPSKIMPTG